MGGELQESKMKNFLQLKNRKGDVSITILVIGVFVVCSLALFSFYLSGVNGKETSLRVNIVEKIISLSEEVKFYKNPEINKNPEEMMDIFDMDSNENPAFTGSVSGGIYQINGTYYEKKFKILGFGVGEREEIFSVEYRFKV